MCGIFALLEYKQQQKYDKEYLSKHYDKIKHRGPDNTKILNINDDLLFVFHRLAINGLDHLSDQPMVMNGMYLICNGEIYNYKQLQEQHKFDYKSHSDCEIIIHLYIKYGIKTTLDMLDGEFVFILYDSIKNVLYAARDPIGIRSLYYGFTKNIAEQLTFSSEAKALGFCKNVEQFPSGSYLTLTNACSLQKYNEISHISVEQYYKYDYKIDYTLTEEVIYEKLRTLLTNAVNKRLMSDRAVCCLLSGGLDSTLVTALVKKQNPNVHTYAIGLKDSVDLVYARKAAQYLGTNHTEIIVSEEEFLNAIKNTIYQIESYCTTSVRASVGNYLVSLHIRDHGKHRGDKDYKFDIESDAVVLCGDLSDEIFASYRGFQNADTSENFFKENVKLVKDVRFFDVLRSDKSIAGASLEARVPFSDKELVDFVMTIDPKLKMFSDERMEKYLLRKAFEGYLPDELLWRRKEAFSDGVSGHNRSWFQIIKEFVDGIYSDEEYLIRREKYDYMKPYDKESLYYREEFEKYFPTREKMIPYFWRHPFTTELDPSARKLSFYKA